jgi:dTDP-4-amino-4,6-dideoxygalactose transaminase
MQNIRFNIPLLVGTELSSITSALDSSKLCGDGAFTKKCSTFLEEELSCKKILLTTSCTHAIELAALLAGIKEGDEVIMPSYTFVSTANAFVLRGATIVFVDIDPITMNIDATLIEEAITPKTKAIVPVHYSGVSCDMDMIMDIADRYKLFVIEDAAQCIDASYKGKALGTIGHFGTFSFHETKNIHCGEGGALAINMSEMIERAEIIREKGTNRSKFIRGQVDKYTWVDIGSSYLPSELNAAFLWAQFGEIKNVTSRRKEIWNLYHSKLKVLQEQEMLNLMSIDHFDSFNGHIFFVKTRDIEERQLLINHLKSNDIQSVFHYIPLHTSTAGINFSRFHGSDNHTTAESERILRLPLHLELTNRDVLLVCDKIIDFYKK